MVAPQNFSDYLKEISELRESCENVQALCTHILAERNECPHLSMHPSSGELTEIRKNISLCLGPEGGFTEAELPKAAEAGLTFASLEKLILRSETAAVAAAAIVSAMRDI